MHSRVPKIASGYFGSADVGGPWSLYASGVFYARGWHHEMREFANDYGCGEGDYTAHPIFKER